MRNIGGRPDAINLPPFVNKRPAAKMNWGYSLKDPPPGLVNLQDRLRAMTVWEGLKGTDLVFAFIARHVLPLQRRAHIIGLMGDRRNPTWMSSARLDPS